MVNFGSSSPMGLKREKVFENHQPVSIGIFACASKNSCSDTGFFLPFRDLIEALLGQWGGAWDLCPLRRTFSGKVAITTARGHPCGRGLVATGPMLGTLGKKRGTRSLAGSKHGCCISQSNFNTEGEIMWFLQIASNNHFPRK